MDTRIKAVTFDEENHKYWFEGKELFGVTTSISKLMGKSFPDNVTIQASVIYGHDVHKESEFWIKEGKEPSSKAGKWIVQYLKEFQIKYNVSHFDAELLVSDFEKTASCIDIVAHLPDRKAILFDIKTTAHFDRTYCSLQLSVYKKLYEHNYGENVLGMYVLGTKSKRAFRIIQQEDSKVEKILNMNNRGE